MTSVRLTLVASVFAVAQAVYGNSFSITKIADTSTPIPGGMGDFTNFVVSSGGTFIAQGNDNQEGIYTYFPQNYPSSATLAVLVGSGMAAPGSTSGATFSNFQSVSFGADGTSFIATNSDGSQAVYEKWESNPLFAVASTGESPSAGVTFTSFAGVSSTYQNNSPLNPTGEFLSNAGIYFYSVSAAQGSNPPNFSTGTVSLSLEANTSTVPQGSTSPFSSLGSPFFKSGFPDGVLQGDSAIQAMRASVNGVQGIYFSPPGTANSAPGPFTKLADAATPSIVQFTSFGTPAANIGDLVFTAHYNVGGNDEQGIFTYENYTYQAVIGAPAASLQELLASGTTAPGSNGAHFQDFLGVTPSGAFLADLDNGTEGLYHFGSDGDDGITSSISEIMNSADPLDGKSIAGIELPTEADLLYDGTSFIVNFTDGSQGLYFEQTAVPEPQALGLLISATFLIRRR